MAPIPHVDSSSLTRFDTTSTPASSSSSLSSSSSSSTSRSIQSTSSARGQPEKRLVYFGIKRGEVPGVYTDARLAEAQIKTHPDPCLRCFSTRYAALAYVGGWDCRGTYYIPKGTPYPLFEYLLIHRSVPAHLLCPRSSARIKYHSRLALPAGMSGLNEFGAIPPTPVDPEGLHPALAVSSDTLNHRSSSATLRPSLGSHRNSWRNSMVKSPSPLRNMVDGSGKATTAVELDLKRVDEKLGLGLRQGHGQGLGLRGVFTGPSEGREAGASGGKDAMGGGGETGESGSTSTRLKAKRASIFGITAPTFARKVKTPAPTVATLPTVSSDRLEPPPPIRIPSLRQSHSDPSLPRRSSSHVASATPQPLSPRSRQHSTPRQSGLWSTSPLASPSQSAPSHAYPQQQRRPVSGMPTPTPGQGQSTKTSKPTFEDTTAPSFSRATLRRSGVIMPTAAPRRPPSTPGLSPSSSSSSISSMSSTSSTSSPSLSSTSSSPSRFSQGSSPVSRSPGDDFAPPRAGFMRRPPSTLSMSSTSSSESVATITTGSQDKKRQSVVEGYAPDLLGPMQGGFVRHDHGGRAGSEGTAQITGMQKDKEKKAGVGKGLRGMFGLKKRV